MFLIVIWNIANHESTPLYLIILYVFISAGYSLFDMQSAHYLTALFFKYSYNDQIILDVFNDMCSFTVWNWKGYYFPSTQISSGLMVATFFDCLSIVIPN